MRPIFGGGYQIVAGERRWRAARMAGLTTVPAIIRELDDEQVMEIALIENLQREDLSPLEEAMGYQSLMDSYDMTQEEVAKIVCCSQCASVIEVAGGGTISDSQRTSICRTRTGAAFLP